MNAFLFELCSNYKVGCNLNTNTSDFRVVMYWKFSAVFFFIFGIFFSEKNEGKIYVIFL